MEIVYKVIKDNKVFGAVVLVDGDYKFILKSKLHRIGSYIVNASITEDCKIVPKGNNVIPTKEYKRLSVYHGSKFGIKCISPDGCNRSNDFGSGFYTNTSKQNAEEFICDRDTGIMYEFLFIKDGLSIYSFKNPNIWGYFVSYNRGNILLNDIPEPYKSSINEIISGDYDVISGPIADDSMREAYLYFKEGKISPTQLFSCLRCAELGTQVVLRTDKGIHHLYKTSEYKLSNDDRERLTSSAKSRYKVLHNKLKQYLWRNKNGNKAK